MAEVVTSRRRRRTRNIHQVAAPSIKPSRTAIGERAYRLSARYVVVYTVIYRSVAGTNEDAIIKVLVDHNNHQRQAIKAAYKTLFGKVRSL